MNRRRKQLPKHAATEPLCTSPFAASSVVEEYCFDRRNSASMEFISFSEQAIIHMGQMKACPDVMERKLAKMRKEWTKVKEEVRFARRHGDHLSESVEESEKKAEEMLRELECIDLFMRDLFQGQS